MLSEGGWTLKHRFLHLINEEYDDRPVGFITPAVEADVTRGGDVWQRQRVTVVILKVSSSSSPSPSAMKPDSAPGGEQPGGSCVPTWAGRPQSPPPPRHFISTSDDRRVSRGQSAPTVQESTLARVCFDLCFHSWEVEREPLRIQSEKKKLALNSIRATIEIFTRRGRGTQ